MYSTRWMHSDMGLLQLLWLSLGKEMGCVPIFKAISYMVLRQCSNQNHKTRSGCQCRQSFNQYFTQKYWTRRCTIEPLVAYLHCRTQTRIRTPNPMATLLYRNCSHCMDPHLDHQPLLYPLWGLISLFGLGLGVNRPQRSLFWAMISLWDRKCGNIINYINTH